MCNYVFECVSGKYGFFKLDSDNNHFYILINTGIFDELELKQGGTHICDNFENYPESITWMKNTDPTERLLSAILQYMSPINKEIKKLIACQNPGEYYNRSIRGHYYNSINNETPPYNESSKLDEARSFQGIYNALTHIFDFVEPETQNLSTYSNKIRECLILACTEVEYLLKKTLLENNYPNSSRMSTHDYIKLLPYLKPEQYSVKLKTFPDLGTFSPFANWSTAQPTQSLNWYDSYNAVKHDRGSNRSRSSLEMLINSVAAIHILLEAHYGEHIFDSPLRSKYESIFYTVKRPSWELDELAMPLLGTNRPWVQAKQISF